MPISDNFAEIVLAALSLPEEDRATLAELLLESLTSPNQKEIDAAWADEIERRIRDIDEGKVGTYSAEIAKLLKKSDKSS